jgi:hypothetical protein
LECYHYTQTSPAPINKPQHHYIVTWDILDWVILGLATANEILMWQQKHVDTVF